MTRLRLYECPAFIKQQSPWSCHPPWSRHVLSAPIPPLVPTVKLEEADFDYINNDPTTFLPVVLANGQSHMVRT